MNAINANFHFCYSMKTLSCLSNSNKNTIFAETNGMNNSESSNFIPLIASEELNFLYFSQI